MLGEAEALQMISTNVRIIEHGHGLDGLNCLESWASVEAVLWRDLQSGLDSPLRIGAD
jgi:hypothetical protein